MKSATRPTFRGPWVLEICLEALPLIPRNFGSDGQDGTSSDSWPRESQDMDPIAFQLKGLVPVDGRDQRIVWGKTVRKGPA